MVSLPNGLWKQWFYKTIQHSCRTIIRHQLLYKKTIHFVWITCCQSHKPNGFPDIFNFLYDLFMRSMKPETQSPGQIFIFNWSNNIWLHKWIIQIWPQVSRTFYSVIIFGYDLPSPIISVSVINWYQIITEGKF